MCSGATRLRSFVLLALFVCFAATADDVLLTAAFRSGYANAEEAFYAAFVASGIAARGYRENREYAAAIYQLPDGSWYCTPIVTGSRLESRIPYHAVPEIAVRIIGAHTHGSPHIPEEPRAVYGLDFSRADKINAIVNYKITHGKIATQFLLTSDLRILKMSLTGNVDQSAADDRSTPTQVSSRVELIGRLSASSTLVAGTLSAEE